jgi:hypothetical protein
MSAGKGHPGRRRAICLAVVLVMALSLAACGGTSSSRKSSSPASVAGTSTVAAAKHSHSSQPLGRDVIRRVSSVPVRAHNIGQEPDDEVNSSGAKTQNPCTLVSRSQAQAILGRHLDAPVDAPQGPTCIYRARGSSGQITLAVDSTEFSTVKPQAQLKDRMSLTVAGHAAFCGSAGGPKLILPLSVAKFVVITAPCPVAAAFAVRALSRLAA